MRSLRGIAGRSAGLVTAVAAVSLPLAMMSQGTASAAPASVTSHRMIPATGISPRFHNAGPAIKKPGSVVFGCQSASAGADVCYGPTQIRAAYNVPGNITGAGRTIVIVDAFQSPTIAADLQNFDQTFGLPGAKLNIITPDGLTPFDPKNEDEVGWSGEISLDVEYAHAIAPAATIDLVLAKSDMDSDIFSAQKFVVDHNLGDVLSQSFGEAEQCMDPTLMAQAHALFARAQREGMSVFASSGDQGSALPNCAGDGFIEAASTPATDPRVTAVGGTQLNADPVSGAYHSEVAWNDETGSSGGGFSTVYPRPAFQFGLHTPNQRGIPDVAYSAAATGAVVIAWGSSGQGPGLFFTVVGTSAGSPQWAAVAALADQAAHRRVGDINPYLYSLRTNPVLYHLAFHDITQGNNIWAPSGLTAGFSAAPGWDAVTGLGSPNVGHLIPLLGAGA
jgi:subtilase family serine protease